MQAEQLAAVVASYPGTLPGPADRIAYDVGGSVFVEKQGIDRLLAVSGQEYLHVEVDGEPLNETRERRQKVGVDRVLELIDQQDTPLNARKEQPDLEHSAHAFPERCEIRYAREVAMIYENAVEPVGEFDVMEPRIDVLSDEVDDLPLRSGRQALLVAVSQHLGTVGPERAGEGGAAQPMPPLEAGPPPTISEEGDVRTLRPPAVVGRDDESGQEISLISKVVTRLIEDIGLEGRTVVSDLVEVPGEPDDGRKLLHQPRRVGIPFHSTAPADDVEQRLLIALVRQQIDRFEQRGLARVVYANDEIDSSGTIE